MSLPLIISAVVLVIAIIVIVRIYPLLLVMFSKLFFGKYSFKYLHLHKKYLGTSPYGYCIKDDFINHMAGLYKFQDGRNKLQTNAEIMFGKINFGEKFGQIIPNSKHLICLNAVKLPQFELKIAGTRSEMFNFEMKTFYYFANNRFFMGEYSFKLPDDQKIDEISSILQNKYLGKEIIFKEDFCIENENHAMIFFEHNGFHLSIKYLTPGDDKIFEMLSEYWHSKVRATPGKTEDLETELKSKL